MNVEEKNFSRFLFFMHNLPMEGKKNGVEEWIMV